MATHDKIITILKAEIERCGNIENFQMANSVFNVSEMMTGKRKLSSGLLAALGYKKEIRYVKIK